MDLSGPGARRLSRRYRERSIEALLFISATASILVMVLIFYFLIHESFIAFQDVGVIQFLTSQRWNAAANAFGI